MNMDEQGLKRHCDDILIERIDNLKNTFEGFIEQNDKDHQAIITQTTKTNGSVARAMTDIDNLKSDNNKLKGAINLMGFLVGGGLIWALIDIFK